MSGPGGVVMCILKKHMRVENDSRRAPLFMQLSPGNMKFAFCKGSCLQKIPKVSSVGFLSIVAGSSQVKMTSREAFRHLPRPLMPHPSSPSETEHRSEIESETATDDGATPRASPTATKKAVSALTSDLKGVGPATASAILSAVCSDCPFDADEVCDKKGTPPKRVHISLPCCLKDALGWWVVE